MTRIPAPDARTRHTRRTSPQNLATTRGCAAQTPNSNEREHVNPMGIKIRKSQPHTLTLGPRLSGVGISAPETICGTRRRNQRTILPTTSCAGLNMVPSIPPNMYPGPSPDARRHSWAKFRHHSRRHRRTPNNFAGHKKRHDQHELHLEPPPQKLLIGMPRKVNPTGIGKHEHHRNGMNPERAAQTPLRWGTPVHIAAICARPRVGPICA